MPEHQDGVERALLSTAASKVTTTVSGNVTSGVSANVTTDLTNVTTTVTGNGAGIYTNTTTTIATNSTAAPPDKIQVMKTRPLNSYSLGSLTLLGGHGDVDAAFQR